MSNSISTKLILVQLLSHVQLFVTPWTAACRVFQFITNSRSLLKLMSIQLSHPLSSPSPPTFSLSQHQGLFQDRVEERSLEILKGEGIWLVVANFLGVRILCSCICPHRSGHVFLSTSNKTNVILCSATFSPSEWKSVIPLKIRASRRDYPVYFRLQATFFYKRCRASMTKHR